MDVGFVFPCVLGRAIPKPAYEELSPRAPLEPDGPLREKPLHLEDVFIFQIYLPTLLCLHMPSIAHGSFHRAAKCAKMNCLATHVALNPEPALPTRCNAAVTRR